MNRLAGGNLNNAWSFNGCGNGGPFSLGLLKEQQ
jgi:hypothetical protein